MEEFRTLRQVAGWFGLLLLAVEEASRVLDGREASTTVVSAAFLLIVLSVFGPAAAALIVRAFRGGPPDEG